MENQLPAEVKLDIFSRLPAESILECRRVCKTWQNLLYYPYFTDMHLRRQLLHLDNDQNYQNHFNFNGDTTKLGLLLLVKLKEENVCQLYYLADDENDQQSLKRIKKINHPPVSRGGLVGSCNGLICISLSHNYAIRDPVYIFNPITREYVNLPTFDIKVHYQECKVRTTPRVSKVRMLSGFGYHPSSNEYKVVRIYYTYDQFFGYVQVYTLGSGSASGWRNKGKVKYSLIYESSGVLANGALHWLTKEGKIVAFDLADEEFHLLPLLPSFRPFNTYELRELGGWLYVLHHDFGTTNFWSFKKIKSCNYGIKEQNYQPWGWTKEFSVKDQGIHSLYQPFALTKRGEVLFWKKDTILSHYDPKTATSKELGKLDMHLSFNKTITHVNSFVSLKAVGEEDVKIIGSAVDGGER